MAEKILIAEDDLDLANSIRAALERESYECSAHADPRRALREAEEGEVGLLLTDLKMPHMDGIELARRVKRIQPDARIVVITAHSTMDTVLEALRMGIDSYILKPFRSEELLFSVRQSLERRRLELENRRYQAGLEEMVEEKTRELLARHTRLSRSQMEGIFAIGNIIEARDAYTRGHTERVTYFAVALAERLGWPEESIKELGVGSPLHDIGKIGVPDYILNKVGKLTFQEFDVMKRHPEIGYSMVRGCNLTPVAIGCIIYHQERFDGSGYPFGLSGGDIPEEGRLMAVCDAFDAMTSTRIYRPALTLEKTLGILRDNSGTQFDPRMANAFLELVDSGVLDSAISRSDFRSEFEGLVARLTAV